MENPFKIERAEFLLDIFETGAIAKSGEHFNLSAPGASRLLEKLRKHFKDELFVVHKNKLTPTPFFMRIRPKLQELVSIEREISSSTFNLREARGHFRFSCSPAFSTSMLAFIIKRMLEEAPNTTIEHNSIGFNPLATLMAGEVDAVITRVVKLPAQAHYMDLGKAKRCVLLRRGHPLTKLYYDGGYTKDSLLDFKRVSLFSGRHQGWSTPDQGIFSSSRQPEVIFKTDRAEMAWKAVSETDLIVICTEDSAGLAASLYPTLTQIPLPKDVPDHEGPEMALIWADATHEDPVMKWFRQQIIDWARTDRQPFLQQK